MPENDAVIEFTMNEQYFREFHQEWIAARGIGWRVDRIMIPLCGAAAIIVSAAALVANAQVFLYLAGGLFLITIVEGWKHIRRRTVWLRHCRTLPWFGKPMRILLRRGELIQENDYEGDPRFQRVGTILITPKGYLVRYEALKRIDVPTRVVSSLDASVYVPHRAITPAMSKSDFAQRISAVR